MSVRVLDLTPSATGWYYARFRPPAVPIPRAAPSRSAAPRIPDSPEDTLMGYGPDGRIRRVPSRPRLWLLA